MSKNTASKNRKVTSSLRKGLKNAVVEKDVENQYRASLLELLPQGKITSAFKADGLLEDGIDDVRSLLEFKYSCDLKLKVEQCGVLIQALLYIKKFQDAGQPLPTTIFIGDKDECFCMRSDVLQKYLSKHIDWTVAPSNARNKHPEVLQAMVDDQDILPFIFDIHGKMFNFGEVVDKIKALGKGVTFRVRITKDNVVEIFNTWRNRVLTDERFDHRQGLFDIKSDSEVRSVLARQSDIFFACLTDKDNTYLQPNKKNVLVCRGRDIKVNSNQYLSFFNQFSQVLSPSEKDVLVGNKDRIIEEVARRREGAFFTPTLWVAEAHKMLDEALGSNWRDEYVVWDCASGTNNLTRDFKFKELYCSTLNQGDIDTVKDMGYNPGSTIFQYDFLNDDEVDVLGDKVPEGLKKAFAEGKKVLFLINPPYGTANDMRQGSHKSGIAITKINKEMKRVGAGKSAQQLYSQFLYRIAQIKVKYQSKVSSAVFCPTIFMSGSSFEKIRNVWYGSFSYKNGMIFQASNFSDVASTWGIGFTIWESGNQEKREVIVEAKVVDPNTFNIQRHSDKTVYEPIQKASEWIREFREVIGSSDAPQLGSAVVVKKDGIGKLADCSIGYMTNVANNLYKSNEGVFLTSSCSSMAHGVSILDVNFRRCISLFAARKSIFSTWINWQDEYLIPHASETSSPLNAEYEQWVNDSIVYSLFNSKSNQSSLRQIDYKGKKWDILNHFFFMPSKEMKDLADQAGFQEMYADAKTGEDRFVYKTLENLPLSQDAQEVLEAAKSLIRASMGMRKAWHQDHPELHLQAWDAGWAQLKPMLKKEYKDSYTKFTELYKSFEARIREGVYKFGFLK